MRLKYSQRGSLFVTAMIFAAIIAIALATYLRLSITSVRLADRSFFANAAQNLLDTGFEQALWSLNNGGTINIPPANWTVGGFDNPGDDTHKATFPTSTPFYYPLSRGATGQVKVWVELTDPVNFIYHAVAQSTITLKNGSKIDKFAECYLQQRSYSQGGMITRNGMTFNGNTLVDSWVSGGSSVNSLYSASPHRSNATIASPGLVALANADIYGYVSVGTDDATGITVGATGRVASLSSPDQTGSAYNGYIDPDRLKFDFSANFFDVKDVPTSGAGLPAMTGTGSSKTISLTSTTYYVTDIAMGGSDVNIIEVGAVGTPVDATLVITGNLTMGGDIIIAPGSKLTMYVGGIIDMTGSAVITNGTAANPNNPADLTVLGYKKESSVVGGVYPDWNLQGGSFMSAIIYAPNNDVAIWGNPNIYGSVVANTTEFKGTANFHQDESLENLRKTGYYSVVKWRELPTAADQATSNNYATWSTYIHR
jgi:hypothetical protein